MRARNAAGISSKKCPLTLYKPYTLYTYSIHISYIQINKQPFTIHLDRPHISLIHPRASLPIHIHPWCSNLQRLKNPSRPPILLTLRYQFHEPSPLFTRRVANRYRSRKPAEPPPTQPNEATVIRRLFMLLCTGGYDPNRPQGKGEENRQAERGLSKTAGRERYMPLAYGLSRCGMLMVNAIIGLLLLCFLCFFYYFFNHYR